MRVGSHPLKKKGAPLPPPAEVSVCMVTFIPFLSGYFEQSLDILRLSLESLWRNTPPPFDVLIFDNGSCAEVRQYLLEQQAAGRVQYLVLSDRNVGIPGAWNHLFRAAPGKFIAYSDSDIFYYPGWLPASRRVLETYPNVGMLTGIPLRSPEVYSSATLEWAAQAGAASERGVLQDWEVFWAHTRSLGMDEAEARQRYTASQDVRLVYGGVETYLGAGHFQFVAPRQALNAVAPFPYEIAMGNERYLDEHINARGYLRLSLPGMFVRHLGNRLEGLNDLPGIGSLSEFLSQSGASAQSAGSVPARRRWVDFPPLRAVLLRIYNAIFRLYYGRA